MKPQYILDIESIRHVLGQKNVSEIASETGMAISQVYYFLRHKPSKTYQNLLKMSTLAEKILSGDADIRDHDGMGRPRKNAWDDEPDAIPEKS